MTQFLPPNLLALFAPRDPLDYLPPADKLPFEKKRPPYGGLAAYLQDFEDPKDTPLPTRSETRDERKERKRREKAELQAYKIEQGIALWQPHSSSKSTSDPYKTLFVSRINFETSESKLRREFDVYGPIKRIIMVQRKDSSKPRGYAFIEYEHERDMHAAYKHADGKKIDGRRVLVDVERGRTVKGWLPRRLGGGLGNTRRAKGPGGMPLDEEHDGSRGHSRASSEKRDRDRDRRRSRSRDRGRSRRSRSRERDDRRDRDRDRKTDDRDRKRDRERDKDKDGGRDKDKDNREERRRSRDRERRRSRERNREDGSSRKDRDKEKDKPDNTVSIKNEPEENVKLEPSDDYENHYDNGN